MRCPLIDAIPFSVRQVIDDWDSFFTFFNGNPNHDASPEALQDMGNTEKVTYIQQC